MDKVCKNCVFHGAFIMCCFNEKNEGMRVFNPDNKVYFDLIEWFIHKVSVESPEVISDFFTTPTFVDNICCDVWNILINIEEIFDYSTLQPFDKIMIKVHGVWEISFFGYHYNNGYYVMNGVWFVKKDIIPYNYETKHLLGTTNEKPEKYI